MRFAAGFILAPKSFQLGVRGLKSKASRMAVYIFVLTARENLPQLLFCVFSVEALMPRLPLYLMPIRWPSLSLKQRLQRIMRRRHPSHMSKSISVSAMAILQVLSTPRHLSNLFLVMKNTISPRWGDFALTSDSEEG